MYINYQDIEGEWSKEPDYIRFIDEESGYTCVIIRNTCPTLGGLCGYVIIPKNYPLRENFESLDDLEVHGGVTFRGYHNKFQHEGQKEFLIGFDCMHARDIIPGQSYLTRLIGMDWTYKNIAYVKKECVKLAKQLKEIEKPNE